MKCDAISAGDTMNMDKISADNSHRTIAAHCLSAGLSNGLMVNSKVDDLNIAAGRMVWQDVVKIDVSIKKFHKNETIFESFKPAKQRNGRLHLLELMSLPSSSDGRQYEAYGMPRIPIAALNPT
jgi:2,3-bisphosphoglycerate-independent phosphoglycerate mutase